MQTTSQAPLRVNIWLLRVAWFVQPAAFVPLLSDATATLPRHGPALAGAVLWAAWAALLLAALVPSTVSMTIGRTVAPLAPAVVLAALAGGSTDGWKIAIAAAAGLLAVAVWFSGETGVALAQGSAYGEEQRFPLKPPAITLVPMTVSWLVIAAAALFGVIFLANGRWVVGGALAVLAVAAGWFVGPRLHQLSRRWLVVVPAGVVVHDPLLLMENALFRVPSLQAVHLAPIDTEAADLTGGTAGVAVEIVLREADTVVKVGGPDKPRGVALHVLSVLVAPTRPGRALRAAAARRMPVG